MGSVYKKIWDLQWSDKIQWIGKYLYFLTGKKNKNHKPNTMKKVFKIFV